MNNYKNPRNPRAPRVHQSGPPVVERIEMPPVQVHAPPKPIARPIAKPVAKPVPKPIAQPVLVPVAATAPASNLPLPPPVNFIPMDSQQAGVRPAFLEPSAAEMMIPYEEPPHVDKTHVKSRAKFVVISVLGHVFFLLAAWYLVVQSTSERKLTFKSEVVVPNEEKKQIDHTVQLAQKRSSMSAPSVPKRVTTTGISQMALPDLPMSPETDSNQLSSLQGASLAGVGSALGFGNLNGAQSLNQMSVPFFGVLTPGAGLEGTLYDFKQTPQRADSGINRPGYRKMIANFLDKSARVSLFRDIYKASTKIYASQFFIPCIWADEAPKAFNAEKEVQPRLWVINYTGRVVAPETGTFRFVGAADDILVVRFNYREVLDGSLAIFNGWAPATTYNYALKSSHAVSYHGTAVGNWFQVTKGQSYPIEILLGEEPGGGFFAQLMIEQQGVVYQKDEFQNPILPIFRMQDVAAPNNPGSLVHSQSGPIWLLAPSSNGF